MVCNKLENDIFIYYAFCTIICARFSFFLVSYLIKNNNKNITNSTINGQKYGESIAVSFIVIKYFATSLIRRVYFSLSESKLTNESFTLEILGLYQTSNF